MGAVYKATHLKLKRTVALKLLAPKLVEDMPSAVERFEREAQAAAVLDHPNVVTIYSVGDERGHHFIEMEFVEGESIEQRMRRKGRLSLAEATRIVIESGRALDAAHTHHIVHRDIKPANIMLTPDGRVKVMDFGLAKDVEAGSQLTASGHVMGTPYFMSPEQCEAKATDGRSDIYSLAATYFYLLTGSMPYTGDSHLAIMYKHRHGPVPDVLAQMPELPGSVQAVIAKAMAKLPQDRYASAKEMIADLEVVLAQATGSDAASEAGVPAAAPRSASPSGSAAGQSSIQILLNKMKPMRLTLAMVPVAVVLCIAAWQMWRSGSEEPIHTTKDTKPTKIEQPGAPQALDREMPPTKDAPPSAEPDGPGIPQSPSERPVLEQPTAITERRKLPPGIEKAFLIPAENRDQHGNPVVERNGSRLDPNTGWPYEIWLREPRMEFVLVPAGEFMMGSALSLEEAKRKYGGRWGYRKDEHPQRRVRISRPFYIGKYEITNVLYRNHEPSHNSKELEGHSLNGETQPVSYVSWHHATAFCKWLSQQLAIDVRLPTEAEWEFACRAGTQTPYYWGKKLDPRYANFADTRSSFRGRAQDLDDGYAVAAPVGKFCANSFGLHDMAGNV